MPKPVLDAIAVSAVDIARAKEFYTLLGFDFEGGFESDDHVEPIRRLGEPRLMIDSAALMEKLTGEVPRAPNHSIFAMLCATPAEVDEHVAKIKAAGFDVLTAPWDAFWGQRYATVADADGYRIDLFAPLAPAATA
ncbi:putative glyoxalase superfamily protein PhnB [Pacificibacter maritimus]|uniref:Putative glyoxalase superfamily protein PhnB n=1 Tax=Pacificibacter maritimus TaxID=762213 RepID=A0A3N4UKJ1_9RHOB|nr:VOC family protein [Pacificibacter maritimus]RPE71122.1 putative glyoxalase superfamily protein PhnB [Pacificibacter maritimus]